MAKENNAQIVHAPRSTVQTVRSSLRPQSTWKTSCILHSLVLLCVAAGYNATPPAARADAFLSPASGGHQSWRKRVGQSSTQLHLQPVRRLLPLLLLHPSNNCRRAALFADGCRSLLNKTHNKRRVAVFYLFLLPLPLPLLLLLLLLL